MDTRKHGRSQSALLQRALASQSKQSVVLWATIVLILGACYAQGAFMSPAKTVVAVVTPLLGLVWFAVYRRREKVDAVAAHPGWSLAEWLFLALVAIGALSSLWSLKWSDSLRATGILLGGLLVLRLGREVGGSSHRARSSILLIISEAGLLLSLLSIGAYISGWSRFTLSLDGETLPIATFGYANALAGFLLLSLASTVALAMESSKGRSSSAGSQKRAGRWRLPLVAAVAIPQLVTLILCQSRAAAVVAVVLLLSVLSVRAIAAAKYSQQHRWLGPILLLSVLVCIVGAVLLWQGFEVEIPSADAFRIGTWRAALEAAEERPFLGHGLDTFFLAYSPFKAGGQTSYAHNIVIQYLVELGSLGAALVVAFLVAALVIPAKIFMRLSARPQIPLLLGLQGFALHNLVDLTWFFPALFLVFMLLLGLMLSYTTTPFPFALEARTPDRRRRGLWWGLTGLFVALLALGGGLGLWFHNQVISAWAGPDPVQIPAALVSTEPTTAEVDVVVYGTQTSGISAVREIIREDSCLRVAVISSGEYLESPLAQGLSVEDARDVPAVVGGAYEEWRNDVISHYRDQGTSPFTSSGRFVYGPQVAARCLWSLLESSGDCEVLFYCGRLVEASDAGGGRHVVLKVMDGSLVRIDTKYFIDASVEADLARMLGASYRIGRSEAVFNDLSGPVPSPRTEPTNFMTAPQRLSVLLTLKLYGTGRAPSLAGLISPLYNPASYDSAPRLSPDALSRFSGSWTMVTGRLPKQELELNENWSDYPDLATAFDWVFDPDRRSEITRQVAERSLNLVRYLQEHGYPLLGVANIPQYPYVREGPRVVGASTYTASQLLSGVARDVVAVGCNTQYDRHDAIQPTLIDRTAYALVPMQALTVKDHPWLLVSTAISTDYEAYSSPIRMEVTRANIGGAAGAMVVLASQLATEFPHVPYAQLSRVLEERGYHLAVTLP